MKPTNIFRRAAALAVCAFALTLLQPIPARAEAVPTAKVLPDEVYFYFSVPSVTELKARWEKTSFGKIQDDPAFKEFNGQVKELMDKAAREIETQTKMKLEDLLEIPTGEVAFSVIKPPEGTLALVGLLDFGKSEDVVDQLLVKLEDALKEENADRKVQEFQNTRIVVYKMPGADQQKGPIKPGFSYFVKDTQFVVSTEVSALEAVLTNWDGQAQRTFAKNRIFDAIMQKCKSENEKPVFEYFFDPIGATKAAVSAFAGENPQVGMMMNLFLPLSGLNDFRGMGGTVDWATGGYESVSKSMLYVNQPPQGLLNMFILPPADLTPPAWVGEDTQTYMGVNWDLEAAYDAVESMVDQFQGAGTLEGMIDDAANQDGGPGIHVKKDIVDQLSGRFHLAMQGSDDIEQQVPKFLASIGVRNTKAMQDLLAKVIKNQNAPVKTRDFRGETIMEFDGGEAKVSLSVFNNAIVVTTDASLLEGVIRGDRTQKPLVESAAYRQMAQNIPAKTSMLTFQDTEGQIKPVYEAARQGKLGNADIPPEAKSLLESLPPFEALQKYLPVSVGYTIPDENGVFSANMSQTRQ